jgi:hypothetical protein
MIKVLAQHLHNVHREETGRSSYIGDDIVGAVMLVKLAGKGGKEFIVFCSRICFGLSVKPEALMYLRQGVPAAELQKL